ncbi:unnamed protein product [Ilex paraguariensis]|uniref:Uncharacterized protein n=1 Tax=Ilex paraguariensis TaxID=185542 RepID=A0ABC8TC78_9AQUA
MPRDDDEGVISNDETYQQNESCIVDGIVQVEVHELGPLNRDDVDSNRINTSDVDNEGVDDANSEESDGQDDTLDDYCTDEEENMFYYATTSDVLQFCYTAEMGLMIVVGVLMPGCCCGLEMFAARLQ